MDPLKRDFSVIYICENCERSTPTPIHCGKAMQIQVIEDQINWICWKGEHQPCCGRESMFSYEICCENPKPTSHLQQILS